MGMNRTGMGVSPNQAGRLLEISKVHPVEPGDEMAMARLRRDYTAQAQPVGTVPPPTSVKGVATSAVEMIKGRKPTVLIDKLGERLAFERTGVRLYEAVLVKFDALGSWDGGPSREQLMQIRNEELEHFELLKQCIEQIGADPTAMTPSADITAVTAAGILGVITDPRSTLAQALQAVLVAERADLEGWQLLIQLADELGHDDMARQFDEAEQVEERHGAWVRAWLAKAVLQDARREMSARKSKR
jgi:ferritin-like protein